METAVDRFRAWVRDHHQPWCNWRNDEDTFAHCCSCGDELTRCLWENEHRSPTPPGENPVVFVGTFRDGVWTR